LCAFSCVDSPELAVTLRLRRLLERAISAAMPQLIVIGAGPAGCAAALRAAKIPDVKVKVFEKRSFESLCGSENSPRAYPMVLSGRALRTFDELGVDLPCTREPYYGIEFLPSKGRMAAAGMLTLTDSTCRDTVLQLRRRYNIQTRAKPSSYF
jgi:2-polyprenyl-6-methoxyphenol hydroxylase-like FAD-dependent oxidoreductase